MTTKFEDKNLNCQSCGRDFIWTAEEQSFFYKKGFKEVPKRCSDCRKSRRTGKTFEIACASCGKKSATTFPPDPEPVYCEDCLKKILAKSQSAE